MSRLSLHLSALLLVSAPAAARQDTAPDTAGAAIDPAPEEEQDRIVVEGQIDPDEVEVCRMVTVTGSRFRERQCTSRNEVLAQERATRELIMDNRNEGGPVLEMDPVTGVVKIPPIG